MPVGDPQYQINALTARIKVLETQAKASTAKAVPYSSLTTATSVGNTVPGLGGEQINTSTAIQSAVQSALAGAESLVDVQVPTGTFAAGHVLNPGAVYATTQIRPDPVVGEVYRVTNIGNFSNVGAGAQTVGLAFFWPSVGTTFIGGVTVGNNTTVNYAATLYTTITAGGVSGGYFLSTWATTDNVVTDTITSTSISDNLQNSPTISLSATAVPGNPFLNIFSLFYMIERVGQRQSV